MPQINNRPRYEQFRNEYPFFIYESLSTNVTDVGVEVVFHFNLADKYHFYPSFKMPVRKFYNLDDSSRILSDVRFQNLIFHIGMVELISYWKAACPPRLIIKPYSLEPEQVTWWKEVY